MTLNTGEDDSFFLGLTPRTDEVQLVALSGGLLGPVQDDVATHRYAVGVYRVMRGQPITVAIYPGGWSVKDVYVSSAVLTDARFDPSGQVYVVTVSPLEERLTVTIEYEQRIFLPLVLRIH